MLAELNVEKNRIDFTSEYREREMIKMLSGAKWDTNLQTWWAPLSWATCVQARGIFGTSLNVGPELTAWAAYEHTSRVGPCMTLREAKDAEVSYDPGLRPFQRAGVKFLATAKHALIADEMGTGKSAQAICALEEIGDEAFPCLVVCPNSMKYTWQNEFAKWAPHRRTVVITGSKNKRLEQIDEFRTGQAEIAIINWEGLRGHTRLEGYGSLRLDETDKLPKELNDCEINTVIADEAHKAKDPKSKQTRALWWVSKHANYRFALTGTPIANSPEDIWSLMRFVSPGEWPGKTKMLERYALMSWSMMGFLEIAGLKSETREELFKILDPRFIRRTKAAVLPQLPEKTYVYRTVELAPKQRKAYDQLRKTMLAELDSGVLVATNPLTKMTRLIQFASAYCELDEEGNVRLADPSCKVDALLEIVEELGDQQAIVFAESRQLIELAYKKLVRAKPHGPGLSVGLITGAIDEVGRQEAIKNFLAKRHKLMLLTYGAGSEGLSFPGCSTAIMLQRSFSFVKNKQAEDRIHGIGRGVEGESSTYIEVVGMDTIDERFHEVYATKGEQLEEIARDEEMLRRWLS